LGDKRDIRRAQIELRDRAEGYLDLDDVKMPGSGLQEVGQSRLQRPSIEWKFSELLDGH
jgi:hypothetical protein